MRAIRLVLTGMRSFAVIVCYFAVAALVLGVLLLGILVRALGIGGTRAKVEDPLPALYDVNPATELTTAGGVDSAEDRCGSCRID